MFTIEDLFCEKHQGQVLDLFCLTDSTLLCSLCLLDQSGLFGNDHSSHTVTSKFEIVRACKKNLFALRRKVSFFVEHTLTKKQVTRDQVITNYIRRSASQPNTAKQERTEKDKRQSKNRRKQKQSQKEEADAKSDNDEENGSCSDDSAKSGDHSGTIFGCFAPTSEPLAIHELHDIILIESDLCQLDHTLDILMKNKQVGLGPKFPLIFKECYHQHDFLQKIQYIDSLIHTYNRSYLKKQQICDINQFHLDKQLLKIFYISIQAKMAQNSAYQLNQDEKSVFDRHQEKQTEMKAGERQQESRVCSGCKKVMEGVDGLLAGNSCIGCIGNKQLKKIIGHKPTVLDLKEAVQNNKQGKVEPPFKPDLLNSEEENAKIDAFIEAYSENSSTLMNFLQLDSQTSELLFGHIKNPNILDK